VRDGGGGGRLDAGKVRLRADRMLRQRGAAARGRHRNGSGARGGGRRAGEKRIHLEPGGRGGGRCCYAVAV